MSGRSVRLLLTLGIVLVLTAVGHPENGTRAAWVDNTSVSGTTISTGTLAAPTSVSVNQTCVADPEPVLRSPDGTRTATAASGSLTINKPGSAQTGDVLVAAILSGGNYSSTTLNAPAGWSPVVSGVANQGGQFVYTRVVEAAEPVSYTWSNLQGAAAGGVSAWSGVDVARPVDVSSASPNTMSGEVTAPSVTTTRANVVLLGIFGSGSTAAYTPPAPMSNVWSASNTSGVSIVTAGQSWPTPGATGSRTARGTGGQSVGMLVALQPPARPFATTTWTPSTSAFATGQQFTRSASGVPQRHDPSVPLSTTSQYDGPLTSGTPYTVAIAATFQNWVSAPGTASFTGQPCP